MSHLSRKELDELVNANVISFETSNSIFNYYENQKKENPNRFPIIVNILGALLVGLGIILVVAHNWDSLNKLTKTFIAFLPLVAGQFLCSYTLIKRKNNILWSESSSIILFFAVASSISLVSQIYHISGELSGFLLTWMLLTVPLVYLMPSSVTALLYIVGITWYACETGYFGNYYSRSIPLYYPALLAVIIPHYYQYYRYKSSSNFFILLNWLLVLSVTITLGSFVNSRLDSSRWISTAYLAVFCVFYLTGRSHLFERNRLFANPFLGVGIGGVLTVLFIWSFKWPWSDDYLYSSPFLYITAVILVIEVWLMISDYNRVKKIIFDPLGFSGLFLFLLLFMFQSAPSAGIFFVNLWILFVAVFFIRRGALMDHLGILNFGLLIIAILAVCRFFDDNIPFVWRGLFFLATGAGFFAGNYLLVKKRKEMLKNK